MSATKLFKRFSYFGDVNLSNLAKGAELIISGKELRHFKASRVNVNEVVELFDASGGRALANVKSITSSLTSLSLVKHLKDATDITHITLAVGMPKGSRSDWLVEKATEIGISSLIPLESDRSVLKVKDPKMDRWERLMVQASKQSLTKTPPLLRERMDMAELLTEEMSNYDTIIWGCMPNETQYKPTSILNLKFAKRPLSALLVIGPEGDLSTSEKQKLVAAGGLPVVLSSNRLRTETAAIVMVSAASMVFARNSL